MEEGWDGIKSGYSHHSASIDFNNYIEAEPAKSCCQNLNPLNKAYYSFFLSLTE